MFKKEWIVKHIYQVVISFKTKRMAKDVIMLSIDMPDFWIENMKSTEDG